MQYKQYKTNCPYQASITASYSNINIIIVTHTYVLAWSVTGTLMVHTSFALFAFIHVNLLPAVSLTGSPKFMSCVIMSV